MALYPPQGRVSKETVGLSTPSKLIPASKPNHAIYAPSPTAAEASLALLQALSLTNTAQGLFQAIPCYPLTEAELRTIEPLRAGTAYRESMDFGSDDSQIARDSAVIRECRDCWSVLPHGVVKRKDERKFGRRTRAGDDDDECLDDNASDDFQLLVGKYSWPLLEWFACLFRKDRDANEGESLTSASSCRPFET